jgi:PAS domain S-box-containing protein
VAKRSFAEILREVRRLRGISQEDLSLRADLHRTYVSLLERELRTPSLKTLVKICEVLAIKPSLFMDVLDGNVPDVESALSDKRPERLALDKVSKLLNESSSLICLDERGYVLEVNCRLCKLLEMDCEKILGQSITHFIADIDQPKVKRALYELQTRDSLVVEIQLVNRTKGKGVPTVTTFSIVTGDSKGPRIFVGIITDISEQVRMNEALTRTNSDLSALFQSHPDVIMTVDDKGKIVTINRAFPGLPEDEMVGRNIYDLITDDEQRHQLGENIDNLMIGGRSFQQDVFVGGGFSFLLRGVKIEGSVGDGQALLIAQNTTALRKIEADLKIRDRIRDSLSLFFQYMGKVNEKRNLQLLLESLGRVLVVDCVFVALLKEQEDGERILDSILDWVEPGSLNSEEYTEAYKSFFVDDFFRSWLKDLKADKVVKCNIRGLEIEAQYRFAQWGVRSLVLLPILLEGKLWGILGFHDCSSERIWSGVEIRALRIVTNVLARFLSFGQMEKKVAFLESNDQRSLMLSGKDLL